MFLIWTEFNWGIVENLTQFTILNKEVPSTKSSTPEFGPVVNEWENKDVPVLKPETHQLLSIAKWKTDHSEQYFDVCHGQMNQLIDWNSRLFHYS